MVDANQNEFPRETFSVSGGIAKVNELLKAIVGYFAIPLALPLIFLQECLAWFRQTTGLSNRSLEGKVVLITGASCGIGESLATYFYRAGCRLILAARRKQELERVRDSLVRMQTNGKVYVPAVLELDLADLTSIPSKANAAIAIYDTVDIVINNAGIFNRGSVLETIMEVDQQVMNVNYFGALALTKVIGNQMLKQNSGHIVFMSSVVGKIAIPNSAAYSASKHALQALADSLRAEVAAKGIKVTVISPSFVKTDITVNAFTTSGEKYGRVTQDIASGYTPDYVAERTFKAVVNEESDVVIAPLTHKASIYIRTFLPSLCFLIMKFYARRFRKDQ
ncbi:Dehydrogenase/reductase SDR family protein 7-like [Orchesella cincta]|uniref:Dehydrogenase/reductase SDR family protein 7-like n=1 Tax=Orchesella cincta TaxID=48709 RepID=A0A1D2N3Q9_ORCCI|nr:Dehydrogenase/reductase SDR family protein 7-like [Orchesella cincta]